MPVMSTALAKRDAAMHGRPENRLVEYLTSCWQEGEDATTDRQAQWRELWSAYQGRQDWSRKAKWQSQLFVPKVWMHVEKASAEIRRAMLQTQKLFKLELDDSSEKAQISTYEGLLAGSVEAERQMQLREQIRAVNQSLKEQLRRMALDDARFKSDLMLTNLAAVYSEMVKVAFLLGLGIIKVGWNSKTKAVVFKNIDPFNFHVCPDWEPTSGEEPSWVMERAMVALPDLYGSAKRRNSKAGGELYDLKALDALQSDYVGAKQEEQDARRGIGPRTHPGGKVELKFFWGDVPREDFKGWEGRSWFVVVANDRHIIRKGVNPFDHGKPPYVLTMPLTYPFRGHCGSSLVEPIVRMNYTYNNILNLFVDGLNFTINKQFQLDPTKLRDQGQMNTVYPGKIWKVNTGADARPVLTEIPVAAMSADSLRGLELLGSDMQEATGVTEFLQGIPGRRTKTLGEIQIKTQESRGLFDVIARDLEQNSLQDVLEMAYDVLAQCAGYEPRDGHYHVSANGVSQLVAQGQLLEGIGSILTLAMKAPPLAQMTKIGDLWEKLLSIHNLSDCYQEAPESAGQALTPEQANAMATKAEADAKQMVAGMTPQEIQEAAP